MPGIFAMNLTEATMDRPLYKDCERCGFPNELDAELCVDCYKEFSDE